MGERQIGGQQCPVCVGVVGSDISCRVRAVRARYAVVDVVATDSPEL